MLFFSRRRIVFDFGKVFKILKVAFCFFEPLLDLSAVFWPFPGWRPRNFAALKLFNLSHFWFVFCVLGCLRPLSQNSALLVSHWSVLTGPHTKHEKRALHRTLLSPRPDPSNQPQTHMLNIFYIRA